MCYKDYLTMNMDYFMPIFDLDDNSNTFILGTDASSTQANVINGMRGNDNITGSNFVDFINGGTGNDTLFGLGGNDALVGDSGNDSLFGGSGNDFIRGGTGNDLLQGNSGDDRLTGNDGDDIYEVNLDGISRINDDWTATQFNNVPGYTGGDDIVKIYHEINDIRFQKTGNDLYAFSIAEQVANNGVVNNFVQFDDFFNNNAADDIENIQIIGSDGGAITIAAAAFDTLV